MNRIAIMTDSNSGITQTFAQELDIFVLPMPFYIEEELYKEDINLTQEQFYEYLKSNQEISTSQPNPMEVTEMWDRILKEYDQIVYMPMSSGLSASCSTAMVLAQDYENKVFVVDNQRISVTMYQAILDMKTLIKQGKDGREIKRILEDTKKDSSIYITLETLKYLKKGGRITPAAAALGTVLNLKPVLQIQGEKLDAFSKARGKAKAKKIMLDAMKTDVQGRFGDLWKKNELALEIAYTDNLKEAQEFAEEVKAEFGLRDIYMAPLSLSISCHIGQGALAIACARIIR